MECRPHPPLGGSREAAGGFPKARKNSLNNWTLMNRIDKLFREKTTNILSVYFTAGYPNLDSTVRIIKALADSGADMIEIGMPFLIQLPTDLLYSKAIRKHFRMGLVLNFFFSSYRISAMMSKFLCF